MKRVIILLVSFVFLTGCSVHYNTTTNTLNLTDDAASTITTDTTIFKIHDESGNEYGILVPHVTKRKLNKDKLFYTDDDLEFDSVKYDTTKISDQLHDVVANENRHAFSPSTVSEDCTLIVGTPETRVDIPKLFADIVKNNYEGNYDLCNYYMSDYDDSDSVKAIDFVKKVNDFHITWSNGGKITARDCGVRLASMDPYTIEFDEELVNKQVAEIVNKYDTAGKLSFNFTTHDGKEITVSGGTWGNIADTAAEEEWAREQIKELNSVDSRDPIMKVEMDTTLPDTYAEVDKINQHVYYYKNGELVMDSPCVTGQYSKHDTPEGVFYVMEHVKNKVLRGPGYASPVKRWMRLTGEGVGFHDASWRSKFGGEIYKHDGSHGCINLPTEFAYELYDNSDVNLCTVIY